MTEKILFVAPIFATFLFVKDVSSQKVIVSWNKNTEPDIAFYSVYVGYQSRTYLPEKITVLHPDTSVIVDVIPNIKHYFAVTATDTAGNESYFSDEVSYVTNEQIADSLIDDFAFFDQTKWIKGTNSGNFCDVVDGKLRVASAIREDACVYSVPAFHLRDMSFSVTFAKPGGVSNVGFSPDVDIAARDGFKSRPNMYRFYVANSGFFAECNSNGTELFSIQCDSGAWYRDSLVVKIIFKNDSVFAFVSRGISFDLMYHGKFALPHGLDGKYFVEIGGYNTPEWGETWFDDFVARPLTSQQPVFSIYDVNNDGAVNVMDWFMLLRRIGYSCGHAMYDQNYDLVINCIIDGEDKAFFARTSNFLKVEQ